MNAIIIAENAVDASKKWKERPTPVENAVRNFVSIVIFCCTSQLIIVQRVLDSDKSFHRVCSYISVWNG